MKTTGHELRSEAAIYGEGTSFKADDLIREYREYCANMEEVRGDEPMQFQSWMEHEHPECC